MQDLGSTSRVVFNTLASYARSVFALFIGLFTSRWVLNALGASDYGLYALTGSVVLLSMFVNTALSIAVARFFAYTLGQCSKTGTDPNPALKEWFNTAFSLHLLVGVILFTIVWPLGEYWALPRLNIPDPRRATVSWVFRTSVLTSIVTVMSVPYVSMLTAHQRIAEMSAVQVLGNLFILLGAWSLRYVKFDRLLYYALYTGLISSGILGAQMLLAIRKYPSACHISPRMFFRRSKIRQLMSYLGWKLFGTACVFARSQGLPIIVNLHFGSVLNAALSISQNLSNHAQALSQSVIQAMQPALTSIYASDNRDLMIRRVMQSCRLASALMLLFVVPLWGVIPDLLKLWLRQPPPFTAELFYWAIAALIAEKLTNGHMIAVNAHGRIREYEIVQGLFFLLAVPLTWLGFRLWNREVAVGEAIFVSTFLYCIGRVAFAKWLTDIPVRVWLSRVVLRLIAAAVPGVLTAAAFGLWWDRVPIFNMLLQILMVGIATLGGVWLFAVEEAERNQAKAWIAKLLRPGVLVQNGLVNP